MLLSSSSCLSLVFSSGMGVCGRSVFDSFLGFFVVVLFFFFFFLSLASVVLLSTLYWLPRRCSLTSALFCISYDFGSDFLKLLGKMLQEKRKLTKKKKYVVSVLMSK